ncbi:DUF3558 family protein [Actinopolyspora sp. H202]|uniref:DUF3558 family protein n=1 Tax=Actinopolyspora sp. H202 TaxID=1500456 RepID=UPI003EE80F7B
MIHHTNLKKINKKTFAATAVLLAAAAISSCSSSNGTDTDGETERSSQESTDAVSLENISPCETLNQKQENKINTENTGTTREAAGSKSCRWTLNEGALSVAFHPNSTLGDINLSEGDTRPFSVNSKKGKISQGISGESCTVAIPVNNSETVTVDTLGEGNTTSCDLAKKIAPMVEQNISDS